MSFSNVGMILAAGYGKRMLPFTQSEPKPLLDINGTTLLENSINFIGFCTGSDQHFSEFR